MKAVIDASAAIELVLDRKKAAQLASVLSSADEVLAPDLYVAEVTNAIWKYHRYEGLELQQCHDALNVAVRLPDTFVASVSIFKEVFQLARSVNKPAYDMFYLAIARREDATLVSLDTALRKEAEKQGVQVL